MSAFKYTLKVWLSSVLVAPLLMLVQFYDSSSLAQAPNYYAFMAGFGLVLSLPSALCLWPAVYAVQANVKAKLWIVKTGLSVFGVVLTLLPFWILGIFAGEQIPMICYVITILTGIWLYRLDRGE